jgi:PAT family beta-lactamase induction signal transducer AmpG
MGFSSGLPLMTVLTLLQAWLKDGGVDLKLIGFLTLARLPYSLKFLWAPCLDRYAPFGRRRGGWLLLSQIGLFLSLWGLAWTDPRLLTRAALLAFAVSFCSATQDVAVDAYRREDLRDDELAAGSAAYLWGYRLGMVLVSGGGLVLADRLGWPTVFQAAALLTIVGPLTLLWSPEPAAGLGRPRTLKESVIGPLKDFFGKRRPWLLLGFVFFYRFGEQLITALNTSFFMEAGYTKTQIGLVVKGFGLASTLAGVALAGTAVRLRGLAPCLWAFGWLQLLNSACLTALWLLPAKPAYLAFFVSLDHLAVGAGSTVFVAFLAAQTNVSYTGTQYALLTSVMALPGSLMASPAGWLVQLLGWPCFYLLGAALTLPGLAMLRALIKSGLAGLPAGLADLTGQPDGPDGPDGSDEPGGPGGSGGQGQSRPAS